MKVVRSISVSPGMNTTWPAFAFLRDSMRSSRLVAE